MLPLYNTSPREESMCCFNEQQSNVNALGGAKTVYSWNSASISPFADSPTAKSVSEDIAIARTGHLECVQAPMQNLRSQKASQYGPQKASSSESRCYSAV